MSQLSSTSTIPYEETEHLNQDFVLELDQVVELFPFFPDIEERPVDIDLQLRNDGGDDDDDDDDDIDLENDIDLVQSSNNSFQNYIEPTGVDSESLKEDSFKSKTCGCRSIHNGKACSEIVNWNELINYRLSCLERTKDELDMIIKVQLFHHQNSGDKTLRKKDRLKVRQQYFFSGVKVCRELFAFAHGLNRQTVDSIANSLNSCGLEPRQHGSKGKAPSNAFSLNDTKAVVTFINNYAIQYGLPLPGRMANYRQEKAKLLPSDKNKSDIYNIYCEAASSSECKKVGFSTFKSIWLGQCPNIIIMRPASDLCLKCQTFIKSISNSSCMTEENKELLTNQYSKHIKDVKMQRDNYRTLCKESEETFCQLEPGFKLRGQPPCSQDITCHYSFDYAQQVFYPHYAQQVGPIFFKTPRKCQCFGVSCEASGSQVFYMIDEEFSSYGKGANSVVSMIHDHFTYSYGECRVELHMDNCSGQNKNNTVIGYGMWRVMNGLHDSIQFNMMEAGHTKFAPDWHFGLWKVRWKRTDAESLEDIAGSVQASSKNGHNIPRIVNEMVPFFDWSKFCKANFKPLLGLKKYHHYRMHKTSPGIVFVREHAMDEEIEISILKKTTKVVDTYPEKLVPAGLDAQRQWYLYNEIAPLCHNSGFACPKPDVSKPKKIKLE